MNIVRELRKKKGIQQKELAIEIGVSNPTVSDWERNKKDPSQLRRECGLRLSALITDAIQQSWQCFMLD